MKKFGFLLLGLFLSGCAQTVKLRASHFAIPYVNEEQWAKSISLVESGQTTITTLDNFTTVPPTRTTVSVNKDITLGDLFFPLAGIGLDAGVTVFRGTEIFKDGTLIGIRNQFLNHGSNVNIWVGSVQGAYGSYSDSTSKGQVGAETKATSDVITSQAGISLGYKFSGGLPYFSYIYEAHQITTNVTGPNGKFGPYKDDGKHNYYTFGLSTHGKGLVAAIEYNMIFISWTGAKDAYQNALGARLGYSW